MSAVIVICIPCGHHYPAMTQAEYDKCKTPWTCTECGQRNDELAVLPPELVGKKLYEVLPGCDLTPELRDDHN